MATHSNEKHGRPATVLIVDDDEDVRAVAVAALSERFNVIEAESGKEALDLLAENDDVEVVVTDVVMPGISGFHVARGAQDKRPPVKVLMMSAYSAGLVDAELPASAFLSKPFRLRELEKAVEQLLDD